MNPSDLDRTLLLGLLALRSGLIDRQILARGLAHCRSQLDHLSFETWLLKEGGLSQQELDTLLELRRRTLARHDEQAGSVLAVMDQSDPVLAELKRENGWFNPDPPLVTDTQPSSGPHLDQPTATLPQDGMEQATRPSPAAGSGERFRLVRFHKAGGLGEVYRAHDEALDRDVAVKQIRVEHADNPRYRSDFLREAHLTGLLEHPGVVPIYGLGVNSQGRPYYAMRFIEGENLKDAIDRYLAPGVPESQRRVDLRELLRRFLEVCNTLAFAHSRHIIHRDLKPANIMLGRYGETLVVDWGLARFVHEADSPVAVEASSDEGGTLAGQAKGTPAFMAPEQAEGRIRELGPACDIYGLGATLYVLLTGEVPFAGPTVEVVLFQVREGRFRRPREVRADVPPGLEAICLKAMALKPVDRYATAKDLADDIARWLADEPPQAYPEPLLERVGRYARRYRSATAAFALALLGITLVSLIALFTVNQARQAEARAYAINTTQRDLRDALRRTDWDEQQLTDVEDRLADLERLDANALPEGRERAADAVGEAVAARLGASTLTTESREKVERLIAWLSDREPERARVLRANYNQRLRDWQRVFELKAPFANLGEVVDPKQVETLGPLLVSVWPEPPEGLPVVRTRQAPVGNVQLEADFAPTWTQAPMVGLVLQAGETGGYQFYLSSYERYTDSLGRRDPLDRCVSQRDHVYMSIARDNVVLARTQALLDPGPLRLLAQREGNRLRFQVNGLPPLLFEDLFASPPLAKAPFALLWSAGVELQRLEGNVQALPLSPSLTEKGDELFAQRQYDAALVFFQSQPSAEARFKSGLCLYELGRKDEANALLQAVAATTATESRTWKNQALARLWLWELRKEDARAEDSNRWLRQLPSDLTADRLAVLIPAELRREALGVLRLRGSRWRRVWDREGEVAMLQLAVLIEERLNESDFERRQTRWKLCDALRADGQLETARVRMRELLGESGIPDAERVVYERDYIWMLIESKQLGEALQLVDALLAEKTAPEYLPLYLERARVLAIQEKGTDAVKALDTYLNQCPAGVGLFVDHGEACLLKGLLLRRQGNEKEAQEIWRQGLLRNWPGGLPELPRGRFPSMIMTERRDNTFNVNMMLMSLTGEVTAEEARTMLTLLQNPGGVTTSFAKVMLRENFSPELVRQIFLMAYTDPRGLEIAWRRVLRQVDFRGFYIEPFKQSLVCGFKAGAITGEISPEVDALIRKGVAGLFEAYEKKRLDTEMLECMFRLWYGGEGLQENWAKLGARFEPDLRIPAAYLFGRRYLHPELNRPASARIFLEEVAKTTRPEFEVEKKLAQDELRKLDTPKP